MMLDARYFTICAIFYAARATPLIAEKLNLDVLNNYSEFLNFGDKKLHKLKSDNLENAIFKSKLEVLGEIFKKNVEFFKMSDRLDIVFLVDASSSVGDDNFRSELKFIKKMLSDITVDYNHTRVAVVTFSSPSNTVVNLNYINRPSKEHNKCLLLNDQLVKIEYSGGETYTVGAFQKAKEIFEDIDESRNDSKKILFLITDGYSNGESPLSVAGELKEQRVTIFTVGIRNGNYKELYELSSSPGEFYSYLLDSFDEFEGLARRALHVDLSTGNYIPLGVNGPCDKLCEGGDCCDERAVCTCGTTTGHYSCVCQSGFYGSGLKNDCLPCTAGTYSHGPNLCLPCPDVHHTTMPPALGRESCVCKEGFQSDGNDGCKILKCPKMSAPQHGYIVKKKECSNVLNSACGIRCEVGYTLVGSSIRLCRDDATWSGIEPTCEVKTCSRPAAPKNGHMTCEHADLNITYDGEEKYLPVDTICNFGCEDGRVLIGSAQRTCLPIAQWDGLRSTCKQIKCNKLPQISYGHVEPPSCTAKKQEYGNTCQVVCDGGFRFAGREREYVCGKFGRWTGEVPEIPCSDDVPPELVCPDNITITTLPGKNYAQVSWDAPNVTDNSRMDVTVWSNLGTENLADIKFEIGTTTVNYFAQDIFRNTAKCKFFVQVKDNEPPIIEGCVNPAPFLTTNAKGENITWDEPLIYDNSRNVTVTKNKEFGIFAIGTTTVTYEARDLAGNRNECNINITVEESKCEPLWGPDNGSKQCTDSMDQVQCLITCQEGYAIPLQTSGIIDAGNATSFLCTHADAVWYNPGGLAYPECSVTKIPEDSERDGSVDIALQNDACDDKEIAEIENEIRTTLSNEICSEGPCSVNLSTECDRESIEESSNRIVIKRQVFQEVPHRNKEKRNKKRLNVKFQVRGKYVDGAKTPSTKLRLHNANATLKYGGIKFVCPAGFIPRKNRCVQCPRGTFHNETGNRCQSCDFGFYNDELGRTRCKPCPPNHSTGRVHCKSAKECKGNAREPPSRLRSRWALSRISEQCPPGTRARRKIIKHSKHQNGGVARERATLQPHCLSCPVGSYQQQYGQLKCVQCPEGHTTATVRSGDSSFCIPTSRGICTSDKAVCEHGKCHAVNGYEYACACDENYIGTRCEKHVSECVSRPCLGGGTCVDLEGGGYRCECPDAFAGKRCETSADECAIVCENNGTCVEVEDDEVTCLCPKGFEGQRCERVITYCTASTCDNNATCVEEADTFRCECRDGHIGKRCSILPCDYRPCEQAAVCVNLPESNATRQSYRCVCPDGYTGEKCSHKINHCADSPCRNGGRCVDGETNYACVCEPPFHGDQCQLKRNTRYMLNFPRYDVNDYVKLRGFKRNLSAISACLWMQTVDNFNYGTLLSYATRQSDNAFTLTDYTGLVLYVNNQYVVTDVLLNDGYWHHVCALWQSRGGVYRVYVDGKSVKNGTGLATSSYIEGHGFLIVGQEQDIIGGKFSQAESFVGNMAYVDVWSYPISDDDILNHLNDCRDTSFGNLYSWPEMQDNINGNVQILNTSFCQKCSDPKPLYNGLIDLVDNTAFYSCYPGYEISHKSYSKGRKCTKTSKWEGFYEPYCKRVYCGYPGHVANAYSIGNRFYYNEKITYRCYDGFELAGNGTIVCRADGQWYPDKPRCLGTRCPMPEVSGGTIAIVSDQTGDESDSSTGGGADFGTQIKVSCRGNAGVASLLTCTENGTWDVEAPTCVPPVGDDADDGNSTMLNCAVNLIPKAPENAVVDQDSLRVVKNGTENVVRYKCKPGFRLSGHDTSVCITDGYWSELNMTCKEIRCPEPPTFKNMRKTKTDAVYRFGAVQSYECDDGYKLFGSNNNIRCTAAGKWTRMLGKCTRKACGKPPAQPGARIAGNSYLYGDKVTLSCADGRSVHLLCDKSATWSGPADLKC
ncbi:sushi, von Willebrand factor type A, EGF and pentraxin domain-containing protein 1-like isoform X2 [Cylas formicarius]|uniref:sushi, von Willebrand factor type A, EGF and pentraxin domain-containing protein 1-like isoform X2 n=1 Tax=Cylas formicarius TaxID=197179 RepID=UPI0029583599|nr:sushi, von Willebrand factor type A, EGF and pentraxin domain-containing protein 1-like isoform X2 [Cylas formicarius]